MFPVISALNRVIVRRFYERNSGFFLFVFLVMFGVVEASQIINYHLSLIAGMLSSGIFMAIVFSFWLAYALKCIQFVNETLNNPRFGFLYLLRGCKLSLQFEYFSFVIFLLFLPVIIYSIFVIGVAIATQHWMELTLVLVFLASLITASAWVALMKLNNRMKQSTFINLPIMKTPINKSLFIFYLSHLFKKRSIPILLTKLFSIVTVIGFFHIQVDHYELRIALLGLLIGLSGHTLIIFELRRFEDESLTFVKNMPISIISRYMHLFIVYAILLVPELILIGINHVKIFDSFLVWIFGISYLLFNHMSLYPIRMSMDRFIIRLLLFFLISFILVLYKVFLIFTLAMLVFSFLIYRKWYYRFEV